MLHSDTLGQLHTPLIPILRHVLALAPLPQAGIALDLACGPGLKAALLAQALGPGVCLIGVDIDPAAIRSLVIEPPNRRTAKPQNRQTAEPRAEHQNPGTGDRRQGSSGDPRSSILDPRSSPLHLATPSPLGVVGDALALPLRDGCCDAAFCIAALGLFADRPAALRELRRALRPGRLALLAVGTQAWAQAIRWPADLAAHLALAYSQALAEGAAPILAAPDLGGELAELLTSAGFAMPLVRAFWLDRGPGIGASDSWPDAELPLLPWPALRMLLAGRLAPAELARCDQLAAAPDVELCTLALVALAQAPELHQPSMPHS